MKIIEKEFNAITGETTITERDLTPEEIIERQNFEAEVAVKLQAEAAAQTKRATALAKLEALGLDESDLTALGF
jgi:hypothetical protein